MTYSLIQLEYFYWVCVHQSFVGAANSLKVSKAHISQSIAKLERDLGQQLFHRTTRVVRMTQVAERIFPHVEQIVRLKGRLGSEIEEMSALPSGLIRMTCPNAFAECYLAPHLPDFLSKYPDIKLEMKLSSQLLDLEKHKIDLAIRLTHEPPLDKVAKKLGDYQIGYYASPDYLKKATLCHFGEVKKHKALVSTTVLSGSKWIFEVKGKRESVTVSPYLKADNHHVIKVAVLNALGIACLPSFLVRDEVRKGLLMPILQEAWIESIPVYAVYAQSKITTVKLSLFLTFLKGVIHS